MNKRGFGKKFESEFTESWNEITKAAQMLRTDLLCPAEECKKQEI